MDFKSIKDANKDNTYFTLALTHSSAGEDNYERLEFLGDRVLSLVIADTLYKAFPNETEGDLARRHTALVNGDILAQMGRKINLGDHIEFSESEKLAGGAENNNILCDVVESVIGAIFLDQGFDTAQDFIINLFGDDVLKIKEPPIDPKTALQEYTQSKALGLPLYTVLKTDGPDHAPIFTIEVSVDTIGKAEATAASKREAQKQAAEKLLRKIK